MDPMTYHPMDAVVKLNQEDLDMIIRDAKLVVEDALQHKNPEMSFMYAENLIRMQQASWVTLAHWCYEMNKVWGEDGFESDDDFIIVASSRLNKSAETIRRYLEVWTWVMVNPGHSKKRLEQLCKLSLQGLWYVKAASKEGQLTAEDWDEIETAPDVQTLREIGRRVRGEVGRAKGALKFSMAPDGTIRVRTSGPWKVWGWTNIDSEDKDIQAGIERFEGKCGVFRVH